MKDNPKLLSLLGMCRKARKLSCGHDAAVESVRRKEACLCFLSSDASERLKSEMQREIAMNSACIDLIELNSDMTEIGKAVGLKSAVLTVNDSGFAQSMRKLSDKEVTE